MRYEHLLQTQCYFQNIGHKQVDSLKWVNNQSFFFHWNGIFNSTTYVILCGTNLHICTIKNIGHNI